MTAWVNTVSRSHVLRGVEGGFTQANHGKPWALRKMHRGDWIAFYSPRTDYPDGAPVQAFTAIGQVTDDEAYQSTVSEDFQPWRRDVRFVDAHEAPIRPLLEDLHMVTDSRHWGYVFRRGVIEIDQHDLELIRAAMGVTDD
ncbi:EVE domain-containing protein [Pseudactinotalea sp.]|uniref:EVE domain-containing protein n=1 Tax=Pseudactinotalea sp. TaxID=1926260 RepID=UPI003B3A8A21